MEPEAVFVYGTLKQGERNFEVARRAGWVRSVPAYIEGFRLFHLPKGKSRPYAYPAVVAGEGRVWGEVQWFAELASALRLLDWLEDAGREYQRVAGWAYPQEGDPVRVWLYVYPSVQRVQGAQGIWLPEGVWPGEGRA
ncbi:gamma-glutamylcyclotransferase [Meiothermus sp. QL-1]|uniref:gamma-glutamylcyclotransferase family protein n=1 Tax=Meiothermus sp. QL-1 TaxID=2058095 RepID=UPI000E0B0B53|nr:gamma-glutamylcyclotransferase family protein [Meiothermus sp. QL-1]RDI96393.1 gamma-glutamylcyclotransferase [Meiothermus sp. QL-1]